MDVAEKVKKKRIYEVAREFNVSSDAVINVSPSITRVTFSFRAIFCEPPLLWHRIGAAGGQ